MIKEAHIDVKIASMCAIFIFCFPENWTKGSLFGIERLYITLNPESWDEDFVIE